MNNQKTLKNAVIIVGLETIRDKNTGMFKGLSDAFMNSARTWMKEHPQYTYTVVDARDYCKLDNPMFSIFEKVGSVGKIDKLVIFSHSDWEGIYIISKYRKAKIPDDHRYIEYYTKWDQVDFNEDSEIRLIGCQAGGRFGKKWEKCIAQDIADKTGVTTWAFASRSSQQFVDGGYRQVPDIGGFHKFEARTNHENTQSGEASRG